MLGEIEPFWHWTVVKIERLWSLESEDNALTWAHLRTFRATELSSMREHISDDAIYSVSAHEPMGLTVFLYAPGRCPKVRMKAELNALSDP